MGNDNQKNTAEKLVISMRGVSKWFGSFQVLEDITLSVRQGDLWPVWLG